MATRASKIALIATIGTGEPNTAAEFRALLTALLDPISGTIEMRDCSNVYIITNFDGTGLGINEEVGYAICNGANGTRNWAGKVPVAYGTGYVTMGATGGAVNVALSVDEMPSHSHAIGNDRRNTGGGGGENHPISFFGTRSHVTDTQGSGVAHNNMQPFTVVLVLMKL
jgi:hypothetical protein